MAVTLLALGDTYAGQAIRHWAVPSYLRGIYDDRGRVVVAICLRRRYITPERFAPQALRIGVSYVVYSMTH